MNKKTKRNATPEENEAARTVYAAWAELNVHGVEEGKGREWVDTKCAEAEAEGYKTEICNSCGHILLPYHHFVRCQEEGCPFRAKDGKSLLEMLLGPKDE